MTRRCRGRIRDRNGRRVGGRYRLVHTRRHVLRVLHARILLMKSRPALVAGAHQRIGARIGGRCSDDTGEESRRQCDGQSFHCDSPKDSAGEIPGTEMNDSPLRQNGWGGARKPTAGGEDNDATPSPRNRPERGDPADCSELFGKHLVTNIITKPKIPRF
jgi:hypothetical protein